jgi:hypothetical protein
VTAEFVSHDFSERVAQERVRLAHDDPEGEIDALAPIVDPEAEAAAWEAGKLASLERGGFPSEEEFLDELAAQASDHSAGRESPSAERISVRFRTAREIASETPTKVLWVIGHHVALGSLTELVGRAKAAGKSTFVANAIAAVLDGAPFLGSPTRYGPVVVLTEQAGPSLRELLVRANLVERDDLWILTWADARGTSWADVVAAAIAHAHEVHAVMLVVDTLPAFAGIRGDAENDAGAALQAVAPLQAATAPKLDVNGRVVSEGLAVLVVRHERKGATSEVDQAGRGSSAFSGAVDVVLRLSRHEQPARPGIRVLSALSRFSETPDELVVELTDTGYIVLGDQAAVALSEARTGVLEAIGASSEGPTLTELYEQLKPAKHTTINAAVAELVAIGAIVRTGRGVKGDPFRHSAGFDSWVPVETDPGFVPAGASPEGGEPGPGGKDRTPPELSGLFDASPVAEADDDYPTSAYLT